MPIKSLIVQVYIDQAMKAHNCQASSRHRIEQGQIRLKVKNGRSWDHYCRSCAEKILSKDMEKLKDLQNFQTDTVME